MLRTVILERWSQYRRLLPGDVYFWAKAGLLALLAIQFARLAWAIATPVGPLGEWRPAQARLLSPQAQAAALSAIDPFFRNGPALADVANEASNLALQLFGVRENRSTGTGSAIIGPPDGEQRSYAVGEEISAGITLAAVFFDYVVLDRGGRQEKLYLDQSQDADVVDAAPSASATAAGASGDAQPLTAATARQAFSFAPRMQNGRVTGVLVSPAGNAGQFASAGFRPGDVIVAVNGARITAATDLVQLQSSIAPGARLSLTVERGAQAVPIALNIAGN